MCSAVAPRGGRRGVGGRGMTGGGGEGVVTRPHVAAIAVLLRKTYDTDRSTAQD